MTKKIRIEIDLDGDAFHRDLHYEIIRILGLIAGNHVSDPPAINELVALLDSDGNICGSFQVAEIGPSISDAVREAFSEPIDPRMENDPADEWTARRQNVVEWFRETHDDEAELLAENLIALAGIRPKGGAS